MTTIQATEGAKAAPAPPRAKRQAVSKRTRFEVFKRDGFKCQYCGGAAPEVLLHVDHIQPVAKGGGRDLLNLITACVDCNAGKSDVLIGDDAAVTKQRLQLDALNERREQLAMVLKWRDAMKTLDQQGVDAFSAAWKDAVPGWSLSEKGLKDARALLRKFGLAQCLAAIGVASETYVEIEDGKATPEAVGLAFSKLGGICRMAAMPEAERRLYYIKGIVRNRCERYMRERDCLQLLKEAHDLGVDLDYLTVIAKDANYWSQWERWMGEIIQEQKDANGARAKP